VFAVLGLFCAFWAGCVAIAVMCYEGEAVFDDRDFWIGVACVLIAYPSYFALFFYAAAARLAFASSNAPRRSAWS